MAAHENEDHDGRTIYGQSIIRGFKNTFLKDFQGYKYHYYT